MLCRRPSARSSLVLLLLLAVGHLLAASPLLGGTVYVAFSGDGEIEGLTLQTFLVVTNPTEELKFVALAFRPAAVFEPGVIEGNDPEVDLEPEIHGIPPGQTRMFTGLSGDLDTVGLLEVTGDDVLVVDARLQVTPPSGPPRIVQLPVVTSDNAQPRNKVHVLPGWYRDENLRTSYGLINLADASNQCTVQLRALLGDNLTEPAVLTLEPNSMIFLTDPLGGIGIFSISESRLEVTCTEPSYSYVLVTDLSTGDIVRRGAAVDLASALGTEFGDDDTSDPGDPGGGPGGSGGGGTPDAEGVIVETAPGLVRMRVPGLVHAPSRGNDRWIYRLDLPNLSTIDSLTATVRVRTGPWGALRVRPQHHLLQISNSRWGNGGWDFWVRPDRIDGVVQTGLIATRGLNAGNEVVRGTMNGLPNNYLVTINQNGRRLEGQGLSVTQGVFPPRSGPLFIQLGANLGASHDPKVPSYGWQWFDLEIEIRGR